MVVVAAGNENDDACRYTPAGVGSAITVGSTTKSDSRSGFSNHGSCLDIFAPGSNIYSAGHRGDTATQMMSGTSMACPHVAGAAALLFERNPAMTVSDAETLLENRATKGVLTDTKVASPNLLLFVGTEKEPPNPTPTPKPPAPAPNPKPPAPAPGGCSDKSKRCAIWQKKGRCSKFWVKKMCQRTCNACCMDLLKRCKNLKKKCSNPAVKKICPLTCEMCSK